MNSGAQSSPTASHGKTNESGGYGQPPSKTEAANIPPKTASGEKAFTGGDQGFISLKLESIENINHNTKKFRFDLPEGATSGLNVTCMLLPLALLLFFSFSTPR